jgi:hypothetical protein
MGSRDKRPGLRFLQKVVGQSELGVTGRLRAALPPLLRKGSAFLGPAKWPLSFYIFRRLRLSCVAGVGRP